MADFKLFDINPLNPNPELSKRIAFGTATSEGNMTIQQLIDLVSANYGTDTDWTQLGAYSQWANYSVNGMRSGIFYRKNKIGQLELDISLSGTVPSGESVGFISTLPAGFRPSFAKAFRLSDKFIQPRTLLQMDVLYPSSGSEMSTNTWYKDRSLGAITVTRLETGLHRVFHNLGSSNYRVLGSTLADESVSFVATPMYFGKVLPMSTYFDISTGDDSSKNNTPFHFKMETFDGNGSLGNYKLCIGTDGIISVETLTEYTSEFYLNQSLVIPLT